MMNPPIVGIVIMLPIKKRPNCACYEENKDSDNQDAVEDGF
jgi:hypothetical protein